LAAQPRRIPIFPRRPELVPRRATPVRPNVLLLLRELIGSGLRAQTAHDGGAEQPPLLAGQ